MARDTRSPEEIERDLSETRHHLEGTLDALQARMSPGSMFEDVLDYARRDGGAFGRNLVETVRDNPVPATLLTIGLGWMMMSGRNGARHQYGALVPAGDRQDLPREEYPTTAERAAAAAGHTASGARERLRGMGESVRAGQEATVHGTSHAAHAVGDRARHGWESTRAGAGTAMGRTRDAVGGAMDGIGQGMRGMGQRSRAAGRSMSGFFEENPMAVGALAIAAGAALAAFLPRTRMEDETLGPLRQRALDEGRARVGDLADEAADRTRVAAHVAAQPNPDKEQHRAHPAGGDSGSGGPTPMGPAVSSSTSSDSGPTPARATGTPPSVGGGHPPPPPRG